MSEDEQGTVDLPNNHIALLKYAKKDLLCVIYYLNRRNQTRSTFVWFGKELVWFCETVGGVIWETVIVSWLFAKTSICLDSNAQSYIAGSRLRCFAYFRLLAFLLLCIVKATECNDEANEWCSQLV